jgi:hypothetical protein
MGASDGPFDSVLSRDLAGVRPKTRGSPDYTDQRRSYRLAMSRREPHEQFASFLVERYWPGVDEEAMQAGEGRLLKTVELLRREGVQIRYVRSLLVPSDGVVFSVFAGRSAADVAAANRRADVPFDRIVDVVEIGPAEPATTGRLGRSS